MDELLSAASPRLKEWAGDGVPSIGETLSAFGSMPEGAMLVLKAMGSGRWSCRIPTTASPALSSCRLQFLYEITKFTRRQVSRSQQS
jgi:hypothetical protein